MGLSQAPDIARVSPLLEALRARRGYVPSFQIVCRRLVDDSSHDSAGIDAIVVARFGDKEEVEAADGVGAIHALDLALRKLLIRHFPSLASVRVTESYTHGIGEGAEAEVLSVKKFTDGERQWSTLRRSTDIVEACWLSLLDGYEWKLWMEKRKEAGSEGETRYVRRRAQGRRKSGAGRAADLTAMG